jgi:hypothetical protein
MSCNFLRRQATRRIAVPRVKVFLITTADLSFFLTSGDDQILGKFACDRHIALQKSKVAWKGELKELMLAAAVFMLQFMSIVKSQGTRASGIARFMYAHTLCRVHVRLPSMSTTALIMLVQPTADQ